MSARWRAKARRIWKRRDDYLCALSENRASLAGVAAAGAGTLTTAFFPGVLGVAGLVTGATVGAALLHNTWHNTVYAYMTTARHVKIHNSLDGLFEKHPILSLYYCSKAGCGAAAKRAGLEDPFPSRDRELVEDLLEEGVPLYRRCKERKEKKGAAQPHLL